MYGKTVTEHFQNPRNRGVLEDADGVGQAANPNCGDTMEWYLKTDENQVVTGARFTTCGCNAAVAAASMVAERIQGRKLEELLSLADEATAEAQAGMPAVKLCCSQLAKAALQAAIDDYRKKRS